MTTLLTFVVATNLLPGKKSLLTPVEKFRCGEISSRVSLPRQKCSGGRFSQRYTLIKVIRYLQLKPEYIRS